MGNREEAELTIQNLSNLKSFDLVFKLFTPNSTGALSLDLEVARKPVKGSTYGVETLLEALFCLLPMDEAISMFKLLQFHEASLCSVDEI